MAPFPSPTKTWHDTSYPSISPTRPELSAKGKTILITGGGTGIGAATAHSFASAGASRIALLGRREQPLLDTKASIESQYPNTKVFTAPTDITSKSEVETAFSKFLTNDNTNATTKIDILISNAAIIGPQEPISTVGPQKFLTSIQTNLQGTLNIAQTFLQYASTNATVIEINSSAAHLNFGPGLAAYSVSKLAVYRLWDSLGYANPNINVFHIQPGVVNTDMNKEAGGVDAVGFSDDVSLPANFNVWVASQEAIFLKGKYLWVNWDVDELIAQADEIKGSARLSIGLDGWPFGDGNWSSMWKS